MANSATLVIKILTDATEAARGLDSTAGKAGKFGSGLQKMVGPALAVAGGVALLGAKAIKSASDLQQAQGAVESVFGKASQQVIAYSQTADTRMGLAAAAYQNYAALVGAALQNAGFSQAQSVEKADSIMQRAADMAATFGGTTAEAVEAINAAVARGEYDPLEKYGVALNATAVNAELAARGQDDLTGKALANAKATIALEAIYGKTAKTQGQFARESDSAAGAQQIAAAQFENAAAALGTALLPAVTKVMQVLTSLAATMAKHKTITMVVIGVIAAMAVAILALNIAVGIYTAVTTLAASATLAAWVAALWPILAVIAAVGLVVGAIVLLWKKSETFRKVVLAVWGAIKAAAVAVANFVRRIWSALWRGLTTLVRGHVQAFKTVFSAIRSVVSAVAGVVRTVWRNAFSAIKSALQAFRQANSAVWQAIKSAVGTIVGAIKTIWNNAINGIKATARGLGSVLSGPFNAMKNAVDAVVGAVKTLIGYVEDVIGAIGRIHFPKVPDLNPLNALPNPFSRPTGSPALLGARGGLAAPTVPTRSALGTLAGGVTIINVTGAVDPEGTARAIKRVLDGHDRRTRGRAR